MPKRVCCLLVVFVYWCISRIQGVTFDDFSKKKINAHQVDRGFSRCLVAWMFVSAIKEKKPQQVIDVCRCCRGKLKLGGKSIIACVESAIWVSDKDLADAFLDDDECRKILGSEVMRYLRALYSWAFLKDPSLVLKAGNPPVAAVFGFVFLFAKATALDEHDSSDALIYYRRSLRDLPLDAPQYKYAMDRCNTLLNKT